MLVGSFRYCVEARCRTSAAPSMWREPLDDRLTGHWTGVDLDCHVWGVKWQPPYPGAPVVEEPPAAQRWG